MDNIVVRLLQKSGKMIVIVRDLNMVVVASASPQATFDNYSWAKESSVMERVGRFISKISDD